MLQFPNLSQVIKRIFESKRCKTKQMRDQYDPHYEVLIKELENDEKSPAKTLLGIIKSISS